MVRILSALTLTATMLAALARGDDPSDDDLKKKPITTDTGEIGKLLTRWWKDGTAAGNVGDWYDNRDGEHSPLDLRPWPQLQKVKYSDDDVKRRRHWALQPRTLPHVVFGNSSTSAPPQLSGSNPRTYYCSVPHGLQILQSHFLGNNLYIYPEHRDHDPGHNGVGDGYGDLYPTNTPYLIISQGSSGSDQPFMRALPFALAAFRPEVKKKLIETGLLMSTLQMIFRASNRHLGGPKEYLSGKAHPSVFEGSWVDPLKMVKLAHDVRKDSIPPLVKLEVTEEDRTEPGRDFFDRAGLTEKHSDTVCVIARVWRGAAHRRRLVISAAGSRDVNKKPLTFTWVVLRGDEKRIEIKPRNKSGSLAEVTVAYHERRPIAPGSSLESNRVDIGVFAHNGTHYSAPAFVTFFSLDSEGRTYDEKGRIVEIGYAMGETELKIVDAAKLFETLARDELPARILGLAADQRAELGKAAREVTPLASTLEQWRKKRQPAEMARTQSAKALQVAEQGLARLRKEKKDTDELQKAERRLKEARAEHTRAEAGWKEWNDGFARAEKAHTQALDGVRAGWKAGPRPFVMGRLRQAMRNPRLWNEQAKALQVRADEPARAARRARVEAARRKLVQLGIVAAGPGKGLPTRPARQGKAPLEQRLGVFEKAMLEEFHAVVLSELVLPGLVSHTFHANFVDARLTAPRSWRDVYRHDGERLLGWTRYYPEPGKRAAEFTAEGWLVVKKDDKGRPIEARTVVYQQDTPGQPVWANPNPLHEVQGDERITFEYADGKRKIRSRDRVRETK